MEPTAQISIKTLSDNIGEHSLGKQLGTDNIVIAYVTEEEGNFLLKVETSRPLKPTDLGFGETDVSEYTFDARGNMTGIKAYAVDKQSLTQEQKPINFIKPDGKSDLDFTFANIRQPSGGIHHHHIDDIIKAINGVDKN